MSMRMGRLAALVMGVVSVLALASGAASAASRPVVYQYNDGGPFATQALCTTRSAAENDPPDVYTYPCNYYTSDPLPPGPTGPGWYFLIKVNVD